MKSVPLAESAVKNHTNPPVIYHGNRGDKLGEALVPRRLSPMFVPVCGGWDGMILNSIYSSILLTDMNVDEWYK